MGAQLISRRHKLTDLESILFALALTMGGWHTSNLFITLHGLFGLGIDTFYYTHRLLPSTPDVSITFAYSFLLHVHLHLWADSRGLPLTRNDRTPTTSRL